MTERPKKITTGETAPTKPRRFARPWNVTERDGAYEVRDAAGLNLATVHFEDQPATAVIVDVVDGELDRPGIQGNAVRFDAEGRGGIIFREGNNRQKQEQIFYHIQ